MGQNRGGGDMREEQRALLEKIQRIPPIYYGARLTDTVKEITLIKSAACLRKLVVGILLHENPVSWLRQLERVLKKEYRELGIADAYLAAASSGSGEFKTFCLWYASSRELLEAEFATHYLDSQDDAALKLLMARMPSRYDSRFMVAKMNNEDRRALINDSKKSGNVDQNITFVLAK